MALAPLLVALAQALAPRKLLLFGRLSGMPILVFSPGANFGHHPLVQIFTSSLEIIVRLSKIKYEKVRFDKEDQTFQIDIIPI